MDQRSHSRDLRLKSLYASSFGVFSFVGTEHRAVIMREEWICQFFPLSKQFHISAFVLSEQLCFLEKRLQVLTMDRTFRASDVSLTATLGLRDYQRVGALSRQPEVNHPCLVFLLNATIPIPCLVSYSPADRLRGEKVFSLQYLLWMQSRVREGEQERNKYGV